jgi:hypothetical protein
VKGDWLFLKTWEVKKSMGVFQGTGRDFNNKKAFGGETSIPPGVIETIQKEWDIWVDLKPGSNSHSYRDRWSVTDDGGFYSLQFRKSVFDGGIHEKNFIGFHKRRFKVYPDGVYPDVISRSDNLNREGEY